MLDVRRLRLLRELHHRGTVAAVAEALSYTPSAVSQQLGLLERETGVALLERVGRRVRLTDAALTLVGHTDAILARLEEAEADLAADDAEIRGTVRVAAFQTAASALVAPAILALAGRHPRLAVELVEAEAEEALPMVRVGDVDLDVAEEYEHAPRRREAWMERGDVCLDPLVIALAADHPLARSDAPIELAELAGEAWAATRPITAFAEMLERTCRLRGGFEPRITHRANDLRLLLELVAAGLVVALLPRLGHPEGAEGVVLRPVAPDGLARRIFLVGRVGHARHPALGAVAAELRRQAEIRGLPAG
jgi:DNA-binding transcriptional LysR family regulator